MEKIMTVERVVDLFRIIRVGDKLRLTFTDLLDDEYKAFIVSHKAEIMAYCDEQEAKRKAEEARRREAIRRRDAYLDSVPGLREIEKAEQQWSEYKDAFDDALESGTGIYPSPPFSSDYLKQLRADHPDAVFVLKVYRETWGLSNYQLLAISQEAMKSLVSGTPTAEVKAAYNQSHKDFVAAHIWD